MWRSIPSGSSAPIRTYDGAPTAVDDRGQLDQPGLAHRAGVERRELRAGRCRWCTRTGRCGGCRRSARGSSRRRAAPARSGSRRSRRRPQPTSTGRRPSRPRPKHMLAATPPRRISRSSTRKETESLSQLLDDQGVGELARRSSSGGRWRWSRRSAGRQQCRARRESLGGIATDAYSWAYPPVVPSVDAVTRLPRAGQPADDARRRRRGRAHGCRWSRRRWPTPTSTPATRRTCPSAEIEITEAAQRLANALHLHLRLSRARDARKPPPQRRGLSCCLGSAQWKLSPQAQEPVALGLSIVKPCFSMVSTKSIIAPLR